MRIFCTDGTEKPYELKTPNEFTMDILETHARIMQERAKSAIGHLHLCVEQFEKCGRELYYSCFDNNTFSCPEYISKKHNNNKQLTTEGLK